MAFATSHRLTKPNDISVHHRKETNTMDDHMQQHLKQAGTVRGVEQDLKLTPAPEFWRQRYRRFHGRPARHTSLRSPI